VNADGIRDADVRVIGDTIAETGPNLRPGMAAQVIEATGKLVMPGGVDPHTHMSPGYGVDDLKTGSMAALAGGITTLGTFAAAADGETVQLAFDAWSERVRAEAIADVFLHAQAWPPTNDVVAAIPAIAAGGQPSFKVFLTEEDAGAQVHNLVRLIEAARDAGVIMMAHCEDASILVAARRRLVAEGRTSLRDYAASRPVAAEVAALCEATGAPMYVVHISSARALDACSQSRNAGAPLFVETRPLYLHLTEERMAGPDAPLYVGQPPLRPASDGRELWRGLADGRIDVLGSDHAPFTRAQKMDSALSVSNTRPGMSDLQFMLPMYFSEGVHKRHLPLTRFVATTSTNAARIFGMYPRKGVIRAGSDADIVIWDPNRAGSVTAEADLSNADYSVYEGWKVTGWPAMTIRRGEIVYDAARVFGREGSGQLILRERWHR
jgi:dihydropyrimidinase